MGDADMDETGVLDEVNFKTSTLNTNSRSSLTKAPGTPELHTSFMTPFEEHTTASSQFDWHKP
eukprot:1013033-Pyramimonas_sp.AAC.2